MKLISTRHVWFNLVCSVANVVLGLAFDSPMNLAAGLGLAILTLIILVLQDKSQ